MINLSKAIYRYKRFWLVLGLISFLIYSRKESLTFRSSDTEMRSELESHGIDHAQFITRPFGERQLHYLLVEGDTPTAPLVLFVHGSPGAMSAYMPYMRDTNLLSAVGMLSADRPGYGASDFGWTEPSLQGQSKMLGSILQQYAHRPVILVGHSYGGPLIARMAMDFPDLVDALVMVSPSISPDLEPTIWWRLLIDLPGIRFFIPPALRVCNQEIIPLKEELEDMMDLWADIRIPTTVIQGSADKLVPMGNADFAKQMMPDNPQVKVLMLEGKDHFILWSEVDLIKKEILALAEQLDHLDNLQ